MSKEDFFIRIVLSYKSLLSFGTGAPCLRDYCKFYHVSYRDFLRWSSSQEVASGIKEIERSKKRLVKAKGVPVEAASSVSSEKLHVSQKRLLYPLHISGCSDSDVESVSPSKPVYRQPGQIVLRGIRITFPTGVRVSVREADVMGICSLIHSRQP